MHRWFLPFLALTAITRCGTMKNSHQVKLTNDTYEYRQTGTKYQKVWVYTAEDTFNVYSFNNPHRPLNIRYDSDHFFLKRRLDFGIMTIPFKYRAAVLNLPRQLNTDFNGNAYFGYRIDRFRITYKKTPFGVTCNQSLRGVILAGFAGVGATAITPWTTHNRTTDEYNGLVLTRGLALMVDFNSLTVGLGIGWDRLTDRDKRIWIYQNKPWYGLTLALNING